MNDFSSFYDHFVKRLKSGDAALFIGAGLSVGSGYVDWRELLRNIASEVDLNIDVETDLVAIAQYHANTHGNRAALNRRIIEAFTDRVKISDNHRLLARLPVRTIWTTNYDQLIERAYSDAGKILQPISTADAISVAWPRRDAALYKMHGDIHDPAKAVITKDDYETYRTNREEFITVLTSDLLTKTFLFLGFSFTDPNLDYLLAWIRAHRKDNPGEHYWVTKEPELTGRGGKAKAEFEYEKRKLDLRVADMGRYGIKALRIKSYSEITGILQYLGDVFRDRTVFVSGSAAEFGNFGHERLDNLVQKLGEELVRADHRIVTGFGLGVGGPLVLGVASGLYQNPHARLEERIVFRPFPEGLNVLDRAEAYRKLRHELIEQAGFAIFVAGNRNNDDNISEAQGVLEEFEMSVLHNAYPIPIGATGYAAKTIWDAVLEDPAKYFGELAPSLHEQLMILGDDGRTNNQIINAVMEIIVRLRRTNG